MAVFNSDAHRASYDGPYGRRRAEMARRWINVTGAISSIALVLGLAYWGYALAVRDVTGVPVMRAVSGAMRVAPADPGGLQAQNQGLTVNAIAAMGTSATTADTITLAPMPIALQPDDVPVSAPLDVADLQSLPASVSATSDTSPLPDPTVELASPDPAPVLAQDSVDAAVAAALAQGSADPAASASDPAQRPRPRPTPKDAAEQSAQTLVPESAMTLPEKAPGSVPPGTMLSQIGAFASPELAQEKYAELLRTLPGLMADKSMVVEKAETNGQTIYRLRALGLGTEQDANTLCDALQAEGTECVPVAQR